MDSSVITKVAVFAVFLYSVVLHELAHGYVAEQMGDKTARYAGRLTLNPLPHLDLFGSFLLPLFLFFSGLPVFGWAKPVPYNPNNMRDRRWGPLKVMAAGPLTNILLAVATGLVLRIFVAIGAAPGAVVQMLGTVVYMNLLLAVFNLIPIPPFDGRFLLGLYSPTVLLRAEIAMARMGTMGFMIGLFVGLYIIFPLVTPLIGPLFRLITGTAVF